MPQFVNSLLRSSSHLSLRQKNNEVLKKINHLTIEFNAIVKKQSSTLKSI